MSIVKVNIDKGYGGGGLTELFRGIACWESANYDCMERPVLIMNRVTFYKVINSLCGNLTCIVLPPRDTAPELRGCRMFIDNSVRDNDIEIR